MFDWGLSKEEVLHFVNDIFSENISLSDPSTIKSSLEEFVEHFCSENKTSDWIHKPMNSSSIFEKKSINDHKKLIKASSSFLGFSSIRSDILSNCNNSRSDIADRPNRQRLYSNPSLETAIKKGPLYIKRGNNWKNQWFVLKKGELLYFKDMKSKFPKRCISLDKCFIVSSNKKAFAFTISSLKVDVCDVELAGRTAEDQQQWISEIQNSIDNPLLQPAKELRLQPQEKLTRNESTSLISKSALSVASSSPPPTSSSFKSPSSVFPVALYDFLADGPTELNLRRGPNRIDTT